MTLNARIAALKAQLVALSAELDDLTPEQDPAGQPAPGENHEKNEPHGLADDGKAEALRRFGTGQATDADQAHDQADETPTRTHRADGIAEARRRFGGAA
jgi:hypothetical protein